MTERERQRERKGEREKEREETRRLCQIKIQNVKK